MIDRPNPTEKSIWGCRFFFFGLNVGAIAAAVGLLHLLTVAIAKVRDGKGLETYRTLWLVEFNYIGVLVLFAASVVAFLLGTVLWWREERLWRDFERKYGARETDA